MRLAAWVALGSGLGAALRWLAGVLVPAAFPWDTLAVNASGSFAIGLIATLSEPDGRWWLGTTTRQFLMTGVLGGYTTFSVFSLEALELAAAGTWGAAAGYIAGTLATSLGAVWLGYAAAVRLNRPPRGPRRGR